MGSDQIAPGWYYQKRDFNPRSPCGERRLTWQHWKEFMGISIHAPRVGSDKPFPVLSARQVILFQSTLPVWGATCAQPPDLAALENFNPRSPCGERLRLFPVCLLASIFQSTLPVWGATVVSTNVQQPSGISIHAPRVGSDHSQPCLQGKRFYFNPRSPCGERLLADVECKSMCIFQSTLPVWGATITLCVKCSVLLFQSTLPVWGATNWKQLHRIIWEISIHAPRVGSDARHGLPDGQRGHFNPRSPCGERPAKKRQKRKNRKISIHAPRVGSDVRRLGHCRPVRDFNPRSPCGERHAPGV